MHVTLASPPAEIEVETSPEAVADAVLAQVKRIASTHFAATGQTLSIADCLDRLADEEMDDQDEAVPLGRTLFRRDLALAEAKLLDDFGYDEATTDAIIAHARRWQTVECCPHFSQPEHREDIEALLDPDPSWNRFPMPREANADFSRGSAGYAGLRVAGACR